VIFLGEPLHWNLLLGLALVTAGILFGVRKAVAIAPSAVVMNTPEKIAARASATGAGG